jgi:hypothetical protein
VKPPKLKWLQQAPVREGKQAQRDSRWVKKVAQQGWGLDWRVRLGIDEDEQRGLGCMEGNEAHLLAERMKDKGRRWSPAGAYHMAKCRSYGPMRRWTDGVTGRRSPSKGKGAPRPIPGDVALIQVNGYRLPSRFFTVPLRMLLGCNGFNRRFTPLPIKLKQSRDRAIA